MDPSNRMFKKPSRSNYEKIYCSVFDSQRFTSEIEEINNQAKKLSDAITAIDSHMMEAAQCLLEKNFQKIVHYYKKAVDTCSTQKFTICFRPVKDFYQTNEWNITKEYNILKNNAHFQAKNYETRFFWRRILHFLAEVCSKYKLPSKEFMFSVESPLNNFKQVKCHTALISFQPRI